MKTQPLDARKQQILSVVVQAHVATGSPVASSAVARRLGKPISSATVRHEMADLEQLGYLSQPHTSAGRVPSGKAYEFYANQVAANATLSPADQKRIRKALVAQETAPETLVARAPHVLSELCHGVGLVVSPPLTRTPLERVQFLGIGGGRILTVVMTRTGLVRDKMINTREHYRPEELERMSDYLNQNFRGWTMEAMRSEMEQRVEAERSHFLRHALALWSKSFDPQDERGTLHLEGAAHLLERAEAASPDELRELLQALEEKERLAHLLHDCLESGERPLGILVGLERLSPVMKDFILIGAPYGSGTQPLGSLGLLGRTRMDYKRAVTSVAYVALLFDRMLTEN